jgi:hypothetical protein
MNHPRTHRFRAATLLAAALVWLVNVTLCCGQMVKPAPEPTAHACHAHQEKDEGPAGPDRHADGACCAGIKAFPAQGAASELAVAATPALWVPVSFPDAADELSAACAAVSVCAQDTGPPGRTSFAILVLQRSLPGRAPPAVA